MFIRDNFNDLFSRNKTCAQEWGATFQNNEQTLDRIFFGEKIDKTCIQLLTELNKLNESDSFDREVLLLIDLRNLIRIFISLMDDYENGVYSTKNSLKQRIDTVEESSL
jgi:hypothetical protein